MKSLLDYSIKAQASDIHITENKVSWIRVSGKFYPYGDEITTAAIDEFMMHNISELRDEYLKLRHKQAINPVDGAFQYSTRRFRINIYRSVDGINLALRLLSDKILSLDELYMPQELKEFTKIKSGLFLVVGVTGSGKSTTLASMINNINKSRSENILTVEHPIEYIHNSDKSRIEQMEVGVHVDSFQTATVSAMRQNPNIILIGEMRELETIQNTIILANTGHVVYATLHAKSVTDTVDRIVNVFPLKQQEQIRLQLSVVLKGILHQNLIKGTNVKMVPLCELLNVDDVVATMILGKQKANTIRDYMRSKSFEGNVHVVDNAVWHIKSGRLSISDVKSFLTPGDYEIVKSLVSAERKRGFGE